MSAGIVLADPSFPLERAQELLSPAGVTVESRPRPWSGDDVVGLLAWEPVGERDLDAMPALRVVATGSVGYDHIDVAAAADRGIWVCHVPDYCVEEMADSSLALLLALLRGVVALDRSVAGGRWDDHAAGPLRGVAGTRLGVIGFGRIGRALAGRALGLGFEVAACDPAVPDGSIAAAGVRPAPLDELLASCEAFSLHVALTPETQGMIGAAELARMPPGSLLVNTARAALLDWDAFLAALDSGQLAGAAVDVLPVEPPTDAAPAPRHPRLIVTPHAAWYSERAEDEVYRRATLSVLAALQGRVPEGAVARPGNRP